jgi:hypothetical protein
VNGRKVFAETIPPLDAFATRTPPNPKQGTSLATIQGYVTAAEENGGGWVQLVFHTGSRRALRRARRSGRLRRWSAARCSRSGQAAPEPVAISPGTRTP